MNFTNFFRTTFLQNTFRRLFLKRDLKENKNSFPKIKVLLSYIAMSKLGIE